MRLQKYWLAFLVGCTATIACTQATAQKIGTQRMYQNSPYQGSALTGVTVHTNNPTLYSNTGVVQPFGNQTYITNGSPTQSIGSQTYYSNGVYSQQTNSQVHYSNGKICQQVGNQQICN